MSRIEIELNIPFPASGAFSGGEVEFPCAGATSSLVGICVKWETEVAQVAVRAGSLESSEYLVLKSGRHAVLNIGGLVYIVTAPKIKIEPVPVRYGLAQLAADPDHQIIFVIDVSDVLAISDEGVLWTYKNIVTDGLELAERSRQRLVLRGWTISPDLVEELELDPNTGIVRSRRKT